MHQSDIVRVFLFFRNSNFYIWGISDGVEWDIHCKSLAGLFF